MKILRKTAQARVILGPVSKSDLAKQDAQRKATFNGLTAREWTLLSRNVWDDVSSPRQAHQLAHGAVFPVKLAERVIQMYSKKGDLILDPFLGVGSTMIASLRLQRACTGIELNPKFCDVANKWSNEEKHLFSSNTIIPKIINDDCRNLLRHCRPDSVQLTFTSPPYANFIQRSIADRKKTHKTSLIVGHNNSKVKPYSESKQDFGNLSYEEFLEEIVGVLSANRTVTKSGGYSIWVVKDYRNTQKGVPYVDFHSDLAHAGKRAGWKYHDLIVWNQNEQRSLVLLGYPSTFYTNQNCSFLVVFRNICKP